MDVSTCRSFGQGEAPAKTDTLKVKKRLGIFDVSLGVE